MIFNFLVMFFLKKTASSFSLAVFFKQDLYVFYDGIHKMILADKILEGDNHSLHYNIALMKNCDWIAVE